MTALGINLNCASKKEHVPEIERFIRTVKERVRSARATMPFKQISNLMKVHIVASAIFWINAFPPSTPGTGLSEKKFPDNLSLEIWLTTKRFSAYIQEIMSRRIKRMNPQHNWYQPDCQRDRPRTQIKPPGRLFIWDTTDKKTTPAVTLDPC